jgi:flagellar FliJ protein
MPFRFRLERVLDIRKRKEELIRAELAEAKLAREYEETVLLRLQEDLQRYLDDLRRRQKERVLPWEMLWYHLYLDNLKNQIRNQKKRLQELDEKIDQITQRLVKASQDRRVLERLKERQYEEYLLEMERAEQAILDELGLNMFIRGENQLSYKE